MQSNKRKDKFTVKEAAPYIIDLQEPNVVCEAGKEPAKSEDNNNEIKAPIYFCDPRLEILRKQSMDRIRGEYSMLCEKALFLDQPPKDSFNRWLLERMIQGGVRYPEFLIPSATAPEVSPSMKRELKENIPFRAYKVRNQRDAINNLREYVKKACFWLDKRPEKREIVKAIRSLASIYLEARNIFRFSIDEIVETFEQVKARSQEHIRILAAPIIEDICVNIGQYAAREREKLMKIYFEMSQQPSSSSTPTPHTPKPPPQNFEIQVNNFPNFVELVCKIDSKLDVQKITPTHFEKLKLLYKKHAQQKIEENKQIEAIYCLLQRYQTFFGNARFEGTSLQGALTPNAFEVLNKLFGVNFECFASPLNCYFPQYCSAFPDTDTAFGSRGSFLSFYPLTGSFEANPPFTEELMDAMVDHMEKLLGATQEPLSFAIFIPEWIDPPSNALVCLQKSKYLRGDFVANGGEHSYIGGDQHRQSRDEAKYKAMHGTHVFFVQNDAGYEKWTPTKEKLNHLQREMI
eukprot:TRINITY_DN1218_c0_g1_i1.p1 TRINITY_DN1218_c0_g1~~TRINITY_DN1218_c0_g1_i1.p1  ORF type:complete len:517 (+),score=100.66 TRINITY_DN1218_c0_g1_i1:351-1901(+)